MHFDQFIQYRALAFKFADFKAVDHALENPEVVERLKLRTVCTGIAPLFLMTWSACAIC